MTKEHPGRFDLPNGDRQRAFDRKLKGAVSAIKREADGKRCGDCIWFTSAGCDWTASVLENESYHHEQNAVACKRWEKK